MASSKASCESSFISSRFSFNTFIFQGKIKPYHLVHARLSAFYFSAPFTNSSPIRGEAPSGKQVITQNQRKKNKTQTVWREPNGTALSCLEKIKVLNENLEEIKELSQDALEDAILMGGDEKQVREVLRQIVDELANPYKK